MVQNFLTDQNPMNQGFISSLAVPTHYQILNVDPSAPRVMIRESYLRLKSLYQSGGGDGLYGLSMTGPEEAQRQAAELEEAFSVLNDEVRRSEYDQTLGLKTAKANTPAQVHATSGSYGSNDAWGAGSAETIQTNRSTLKVIKTRANQADQEQIQHKFRAVMTEADLGDGATLLRLRQLVNVSDIEIQERTKISLEYIRAMENNRFDRLPQVVYVKGFMRSYLKYLCVPEAESIISAFAARLEAWQQGVKQ